MPELHFQIEGAEAIPHAAAPLIALKLRITNLPASEGIHTLTLRCQVQIEPSKRRYVPQEQEKLLDLFQKAGESTHITDGETAIVDEYHSGRSGLYRQCARRPAASLHI